MKGKFAWPKIVGIAIHVLVGALMIFAGAFKLFGTLPPEQKDMLTKSGLIDKLTLIGAGELIAGLLLILPWTSPVGVLVASGFWGGVICFHLTHNEPYAVWAGTLVAVWVGAALRTPSMFAGMLPGFGTRASAD